MVSFGSIHSNIQLTTFLNVLEARVNASVDERPMEIYGMGTNRRGNAFVVSVHNKMLGTAPDVHLKGNCLAKCREAPGSI